MGTLELPLLPLQLTGHSVEVLHEPTQLVRRARGNPRVELSPRNPSSGARQAVDWVSDSLGQPVPERRAAEDEQQGPQQDSTVQGVNLTFDLQLPRREWNCQYGVEVRVAMGVAATR